MHVSISTTHVDISISKSHFSIPSFSKLTSEHLPATLLQVTCTSVNAYITHTFQRIQRWKCNDTEIRACCTCWISHRQAGARPAYLQVGSDLQDSGNFWKISEEEEGEFWDWDGGAWKATAEDGHFDCVALAHRWVGHSFFVFCLRVFPLRLRGYVGGDRGSGIGFSRGCVESCGRRCLSSVRHFLSSMSASSSCVVPCHYFIVGARTPLSARGG